MILLDSDVLLIDIRYPQDPRFGVNSLALQTLGTASIPLGIMAHTLLEIIGILSFNVSPGNIPKLSANITGRYGLQVILDPAQFPEYAGCTYADLMNQIRQQMALGDAVQAVQIARFASRSQCLLTWNARHFFGKLVIPVLTPQEWLNLHAPPSATTP